MNNQNKNKNHYKTLVFYSKIKARFQKKHALYEKIIGN